MSQAGSLCYVKRVATNGVWVAGDARTELIEFSSSDLEPRAPAIIIGHMPITLHPLSRRRFLAGAIAAGAALTHRRYSVAADAPVDPNHFALFSDTHIAADKAAVDRSVNMFEHLQQCASEVLKLESRPAALLINGDCAHLNGETADYKTFLGLLQPLREAGIPIHMNFGNHDNRERFWGAVPADDRRVKAVEDRQVVILETPRADWVMLDSLQRTNATPGLLGEPQLDWLAKELDRRANRRVIVMVHHQPDEREKPLGLIDTKQLLEALLPRKQVKALLYGHTHVWEFKKRDELHCINLPAVAYPFAAAEPTGWVEAHVSEAGMALALHCTDHDHPKNGDKHELTWRA
jgi:hypothetical protein